MFKEMGPHQLISSIERTKTFFCVLGVIFFSHEIFAQKKAAPKLENSHFADPQRDLTGQGSVVLDENETAAFSNPAGIGGNPLAAKRKSLIRQLDFPYISTSSNAAGASFYQGLGLENSTLSSSLKTATTLNQSTGENLFARTSFVPNIVLGRLMIGAIYDQQIASVPNVDSATSADIAYRQDSGAFAGLSVSDPKGRLTIGASIATVQRKSLAGTFDLAAYEDDAAWKQAGSDNTINLSGTPKNLGLTWRFLNKANPALAASISDFGGTEYTGGSNTVAPDQSKDSDQYSRENLTLGSGIQPNLSNWGKFGLSVQAQHLSDRRIKTKEVFASTMSLDLFPRDPANHYFQVKTGYQSQGVGFGATLDLGLIRAQYTNFPRNIDADAETLIERRSTISIAVNVADPF